MGKIREFFFRAEELETAEFASEPEVFDGEIITTVDQRLRLLFAGGITASIRDALAIPAILKGRNMICNISSLPLDTFRGNYEKVDNYFLRQIDPNVPNDKVIADTVQDLIFYGKAYWYVDVFDSKGYPLRAHHLDYQDVTLDEQGGYWVNGKQVDFNRIRDFHSTNPPLLSAIAGSIERAKYLYQASAMYAKHPRPQIVVTPKADVDPDPEQVQAALDNFNEAASESPIVYVGTGVDITVLQNMSPQDLQLIQSIQQVSIDFANALGLRPEDVGVGVNNDTYTNAQEARQDRVNTVLNVYMRAITTRLSMGDITPGGYFVKFDQDDYLRADPKTRMEVYTGYISQGVMTVDEVRAKEGLPPMTAEQKAQVKPLPASKAIEASARFSDDTKPDVELAFESAQFAEVNPKARTVKALVVPYTETGRFGGRTFAFSKGTMNFSELSRVKLLRDHDSSQVVGYATDIEDTDTGLYMTFKIASGPEGDKSLAGFTDKTHDGLSIGIRYNEADIQKDKNYPGVAFLKAAKLREVSQVAFPAFDSSRALEITASDEGVNMTDQVTGAVNEASEKTYTIAEFQSMQSMFGKPAAVPASVQEDPNVLPLPGKDNAQTKEAVFVEEAAPYRFDGNDKAEFSADVIAMLKGEADSGAHKRVAAWKEATFAVATTNVVEANPTRNRPELYVDERNYRFPIWNTLYKGRPDNGVQPFTVPKYNSDSGLVANHVEGTEPSLGAFDMTNQTVTPSAVSGKIEINREAWDMGGNPSTSRLIRDLMTKRYFEALEAYAATYLDSLTLTGLEVTLTTAGTDAQVVDGFESAIADLSVARGAESLSELLLHISLHKKLLLAKDGQGRRLIPRIGATNANGTAGSRLASLDLDGFVGRPAWAFGTVEDTASHNSYLLDPNAVWAWATQPEFKVFDIQIKSVYLGLWGYKAIAALDINGIRRIKYDTTT